MTKFGVFFEQVTTREIDLLGVQRVIEGNAVASKCKPLIWEELDEAIVNETIAIKVVI